MKQCNWMKIMAKQLPAAFSTENQEDCIFKRKLWRSLRQKLLAGRQKFAFAFTMCTEGEELGLSANACSYLEEQQQCVLLPQYESEMKRHKKNTKERVGCIELKNTFLISTLSAFSRNHCQRPEKCKVPRTFCSFQS